MLRVRDVYIGSRILLLSIPDPRSNNSTKEDGEKISCPTFFVDKKYHKNEEKTNFEQVSKKIWANSQRIIEGSSSKNCH